jgi:hypothetical protein
MNTIFGAVAGPLTTYLLSILGLLIVACYAVFRLNSTHLIREKVWSSFVGDKDFSDEKLNAFARDQLDLSRFRVVYGVTAKSVEDLHGLLSWMENHAISPGDVKRARGWIEPSRNHPLEIPSKRYIAASVAVVGILILSLFAPVTASDSKTAMLKMNDSGTWFFSNGASASAVWGSWRIDSQSCINRELPMSGETGLTADETKALCDGIASGALKTTVKESLTYQRRSLGVISFVLLFAALGVFLHLNAALFARQLANRLGFTEKASGQQSPLAEVQNQSLDELTG